MQCTLVIYLKKKKKQEFPAALVVFEVEEYVDADGLYNEEKSREQMKWQKKGRERRNPGRISQILGS